MADGTVTPRIEGERVGLHDHDNDPIAFGTTLPVAGAIRAYRNVDSGIELYWRDGFYDNSGFDVYRSRDNGPFEIIATLGGNVGKYVDNTVADKDSAYTYRVVAAFWDGTAMVHWSVGQATVGRLPALNPPVQMTAAVLRDACGYPSAVLTWRDENERESGYEVTRHESGVPDATFDVASNQGGWTDDSLILGGTYEYGVRAYREITNPDGSSGRTYSSAVSVQVHPTLLRPVLASAVAVGSGAVDLHWSEGDPLTTGYAVERMKLGANPSPFNIIEEHLSKLTHTYTDATLKPNVSYLYQIIAISGEAAYSESNVLDVRAGPAVPEHLRGTIAGPTSIDLAWDSVAGATSYRVTRQVTGSNTEEMVGTATSSSAMHIASLEAFGQQYTFRVYAINAVGSSDAAVLTMRTPNGAPAVGLLGPTAPITGNTAVLHVTAVDDNSEQNLTYSWGFLFGPSTPTIASASSAFCNVTFDRAGNYTFGVTVRDGRGGVAFREVAVTVLQTVTTLSINPTHLDLSSGSTYQLTASANDQFGQLVANPVLVWSVNGIGMVSSTGLYTAPSQSGTATVIASAGAVSSGAPIAVGNGPQNITVSASQSRFVGNQSNLHVNATYDGAGGEPGLTYTWNVLGTPAAVQFSDSGTHSAKDVTATFFATGTYTLEVVVSNGGVYAASKQIRVAVALSATGDADDDGLSNGEEITLGTDPGRADSDSDGLGDGWEVNYDLDPLLGDTDGNGTPDGSEDGDADGLNNRGEQQNDGDPTRPDTDDDGSSDGQEVDQGSNPSDPADQGEPEKASTISFEDFATGTTIATQYKNKGVIFSSDPGKYPKIHAENNYGNPGKSLSPEPVNAEPGRFNNNVYLDFVTPVKNLSFLVGADDDSGTIAQVNVYVGGLYTSTVSVIGTASITTAELVDLTEYSGITRIEIVNITDRAGLAWDEFTFVRQIADLDVDSDNNNGLSENFPRSSQENDEDKIENKRGEPGQFIAVNDDDTDGDGVPDFADGYSLLAQVQDTAETAGEKFVPMVLEVPEGADFSKVKIKFGYSGSNPADVTRTGTGTGPDPYLYHLPTGSGSLRIWKKAGDQSRNKASAKDGGDYIKPDTELSASDLGLSSSNRKITLYAEALMPSGAVGDQQVKITADWDGQGGEEYKFGDAVRLTAVSADLDVDSDRDNGVLAPDRNEREESLENKPGETGKLLAANDDDDRDGDGVPDFADGFNLFGDDAAEGNTDDNAPPSVVQNGQFVPVVFEVSKAIDLSKATFQITYDASDPANVSRTGTGTAADPYVYTPASGKVRLWTKDGTSQRKKSKINDAANPGDFVGSFAGGNVYSPADWAKIGITDAVRTVTLYVEGISPNAEKGDIKLDFKIDVDGAVGGTAFIIGDRVQLSVVDVDVMIGADTAADDSLHDDWVAAKDTSTNREHKILNWLKIDGPNGLGPVSKP